MVVVGDEQTEGHLAQYLFRNLGIGTCDTGGSGRKRDSQARREVIGAQEQGAGRTNIGKVDPAVALWP